jgi:predicted acyltransferase (DUF342 family)
MSTINKNFIVKQGLEVAEDLIFADGDINRVGINTREPLYDLQVSGDIALENRLLIRDSSGFIVTRVGVLSQTDPTSITGIDTTGLRTNDIVTSDGTFITDSTRITNIQLNIVELNKSYNSIANPDLVYEDINFNFTRDFDAGNDGDALISRGINQPPIWAPPLKDIKFTDENKIYYPTFVEKLGRTDLYVNTNNLVFNPFQTRLGIGSTSPNTTLDVDGDVSIASSLTVDGPTKLNSELEVLGNALLSGELRVSENVTFESELNVDEDSFFQRSVDIEIDLDVGGNTYINGELEVNNNAVFNANVNVIEQVTIGSSLVVGDNTFLGNNLVVEGNTQLNEILEVDGATELNSTLEVQGQTDINNNLNVALDVTAQNYFGIGDNLVGIVTQIVPSIGINIQSSQEPGKGIVTIDAYTPAGKTIFVNQNGNDDNSGLTENDAKRTIKSAASISLFGDTIKVFPGTYVEDNPIVLNPTVSVEGAELRNCVVTPKNPSKDLFLVNNGCHITDISFIGQESRDGASIVALQPLLGVEVDRYFDAARMIRYNLEFIANETVGFLTSGFSGFAGSHREQDAARLIDQNIDFIAAESVGFLTSTTGLNFEVPPPGTTEDCSDDIRDIFLSISNDLKANSNKKTVGAALSYFSDEGDLIHISDPGVPEATIETLIYAVGIAQSVINNVSPPLSFQSEIPQTFDPSVILVDGGCTDVAEKISDLVGIITSVVGAGDTSSLPEIEFGVTLESEDCAKDIKDIWKCIIHDITRGGNSKSVSAGKAYYDDDWNLIPEILKNPGEVEQIVASVDYSFDVARAIINNSTWGGFPAGIKTDVIDASYNNITGITTITALNHGLEKNNAVKIVGLGFTCPSDDGQFEIIYPSGAFGFIFNVNDIIDDDNFQVVVGQSTLPHTYTSGGTIQKYDAFQHDTYQVKDASIQLDPLTGFNNAINGCVNVTSAIRSCVGIVTTIVELGNQAFDSVGIKTTFPGNSGIGFTNVNTIVDAEYDELTGKVTLNVPDYPAKVGDIIEIRDLQFECSSNGDPLIQKFPSGKFGFEFYIERINEDDTFNVYVGISSIPHTYVPGTGFIVNRSIEVTDALYDNLTGVTIITAPGAFVREGDVVTIRDLEFSCPSGPQILTYPSGKEGFTFKVDEVIGIGNTFVVTVGTSTLPHTYEGGGLVFPSYSRGVGPITQGPYIRNCTNFVPKSIGMKIDGFAAEPGDKDDIGVTGTMSVDSYTQFNQGGIGVSITNGAYAQLVSIFTICNDTAIFTGAGGQCDLTNSNSSFGTFGLVSDGVGDAESSSIYRLTGEVIEQAEQEQSIIVVGGIGTYRPYDGQAIYFDELYYTVQSFNIIDGGSGYIQTPNVVIDMPTGPNGIRAEAIATIQNGSVVSVDIISTGNQYLFPPNVSFVGGGGSGAVATANISPIYYTIESATLPSAGISTINLNTNLNNTVNIGEIVYFTRLSLQLTSSHAFEWVGSGNDIFQAKPALGGVVKTENEVVKLNGGEIVYTSTDQAGNFKIGDGITINQLTGTITGRAFNQSILTTVTPLIVAIG